MFICRTINIIKSDKSSAFQNIPQSFCKQVHITRSYHSFSSRLSVMENLQHFFIRHQCIFFHLDFIFFYIMPIYCIFCCFFKHTIYIINICMWIFFLLIYQTACFILFIYPKFSKTMYSKMLSNKIKNCLWIIRFSK